MSVQPTDLLGTAPVTHHHADPDQLPSQLLGLAASLVLTGPSPCRQQGLNRFRKLGITFDPGGVLTFAWVAGAQPGIVGPSQCPPQR